MSDANRAPRKYAELDGKTFLICVGAAKCATSWLHDYLGALPEVTVSPLKEVHFFNTRFPANELGDMDALSMKRLAFHMEQEGDVAANLYRRPAFQASVDRVQMIYDDDAYFGHFARLGTPDTQTYCDITPAYSVIGPDGFAFVKTFCEAQDIALKLLFIMRDPVDRLWSQLRHMQQMNPANDALAKWPEAIRSPRIVARADYRGIVSDLDDTFPADDILYLFYEDLFSEPSLRTLCDFAGAGFRSANPNERQNRTEVQIALPDDARLEFERLLSPQYEFCRQRFGAAVPAAWKL